MFTIERLWAEVQKDPATESIKTKKEFTQVMNEMEKGQQVLVSEGKVTLI